MSANRPFKIVLTGGPGAGKTATLETIRKQFCDEVRVLPESAGILFRGGFPRGPSALEAEAAQRAIYHVQIELERMAEASPGAMALVCDRGTVDGLAYWPGTVSSMWADLGTTMERELARYDAVIHLTTPDASNGYHGDSIRLESAELAHTIDERLVEAWASHPVRTIIGGEADFLKKTARVIDRVRGLLPPACRDALK